MSKDFQRDLIVGEYGEQLWIEYLKSRGHHNVFQSEKDSPVYWDVMLITNDHVLTFEVKYDEKAYVWAERRNRPPNLFLEYWSETKDAPCGIMILEADYLVYIVEKLPEKIPIAYLFRVADLQSHLKDAARTSIYQIVKNSINGNNNVKGWAIPIHTIADKKKGFVKRIKLKHNEKDNDK